MSDDTQNTAPAVAVSLTPDPAPGAPAAVVTTANPATVNLSSDALAARLKEERGKGESAILKSLGFERAEDLKAAVALGRSAQDEKKTELERLTGRLTEAEKRAAEADTYRGRYEALATAEVGRLPENVRAVLEKQAPGDVHEQVRLANVMREAGFLGTVPVQPAQVAQPAAPAPASNGTPAVAAPSTSQKPHTAWDTYQDKLKSNPVGAEFYRAHHRAEVEATRPKT